MDIGQGMQHLTHLVFVHISFTHRNNELKDIIQRLKIIRIHECIETTTKVCKQLFGRTNKHKYCNNA